MKVTCKFARCGMSMSSCRVACSEMTLSENAAAVICVDITCNCS